MRQTRILNSLEWLDAWSRLPADRREAYWHPSFVEASARWEKAEACCLRVDSESGWLLYPFLRHPVHGFDAIAPGVADAQTAYGYGGPLIVGDADPHAADAMLLDAAEWMRERAIVAEFVRCHGTWCDQAQLARAGYRLMVVRTNVECVLTGSPDGFLVEWEAVARRNVRTAEKKGLRARLGASGADWATFARLYASTADRLEMAAFYRFDDAYFAAIAALPDECRELWLVEDAGGQTVSGAILLYGGSVAHHHLGASDFEKRSLCPNDFLYLAMARAAQRRGCERIVWGGGLSDDPADRLFQFKTHFGSVRRPTMIAGRVIDAAVYDALGAEWSRRHPDRASANRMFLRYRA